MEPETVELGGYEKNDRYSGISFETEQASSGQDEPHGGRSQNENDRDDDGQLVPQKSSPSLEAANVRTDEQPPMKPTLSVAAAPQAQSLVTVSASESSAANQKELEGQLKDLIERAKRLRKEKGDGSVVAVDELVRLLNEAGNEYTSLVKVTDKLRAPFKRSTALQGVRKERRRRKIKQQPLAYDAVCENCCVRPDNDDDGLALRRMLSLIYGRYLQKSSGVRFLPGPICRNWEAPKPEDDYFRDIPDIDSLDTDEQQQDAVDGYSFSTFRYSKLAEQRYKLLTSPPRPFSSLFNGLGQVVVNDA